MKKTKLFLRKFGQVNIVALLLLAIFSSNLVVRADTANDVQSILEGTTFYDPTSGCDPGNDGDDSSSCTTACSDTGGGDGDVGLVGSDQEEQTWNFLKAKGLTDVDVAGIMGNIEQESSFNPEIVQYNHKNSQNPYDALGQGYGLIQWTGDNDTTPGDRTTGDKYIGDLKAAGITTAVYQLGTELNLIWGHMQNKPPITQGDFSVSDFEQITDVSKASLYFLQHIEGGTDPGGIRETYSQQIFTKYSGQSTSTGAPVGGTSTAPTSDACGATGAGTTPDCQNANGVAKILCDAKGYTTVSYVLGSGHGGAAAWHASCPTVGPSCSLDCSGLVNIAVYDVYKVDLRESTDTERTDNTHWQAISFSQLQPGDLIQPGAEDGDHVAIVDHVTGSTIYAFAARTSHLAQPDQVGATQYTRATNDLYLHYTGDGS